MSAAAWRRSRGHSFVWLAAERAILTAEDLGAGWVAEVIVTAADRSVARHEAMTRLPSRDAAEAWCVASATTTVTA